MSSDVLLQASITSELFDRFQTQRERFGWTNREFIERLLSEALPRWEATPDPKPRSVAAR